jgi:hypothetical protein
MIVIINMPYAVRWLLCKNSKFSSHFLFPSYLSLLQTLFLLLVYKQQVFAKHFHIIAHE